MKTTTQKLDTSKIGERVSERRSPNKVGIPHGHGELPYDLPVMMEVERVLAPVGDPPAVGLIGWILELGCYIHGHKNIWVKFYRDPKALAIEVDGDEVFRWIANPDDEPVKFREVLDQAHKAGSDFVEANGVEPGDEVLDGSVSGTYEIKRTRRRKREPIVKERPLFVEGDDVID